MGYAFAVVGRRDARDGMEFPADGAELACGSWGEGGGEVKEDTSGGGLGGYEGLTECEDGGDVVGGVEG